MRRGRPKGRGCGPRTGSWQRRADLEAAREGELKSLSRDRSLDYKLDNGGGWVGGWGLGCRFHHSQRIVKLSASLHPASNQFPSGLALELRLIPGNPQTT